MKKSLFIGLMLLVVSCENPFSNAKLEQSPADYAIQNTENGKILLRLKPSVGDKTNLQLDVNIEPQEMLVPLDTHFIGDLKLRVSNTTEDESFYTVDFQRIQFNTSVLGTTIAYDSQGDNAGLPVQLQREIENILAHKVDMTLDSLAHIKSIAFGNNKNDFTSKSIDLNTLFIPLPEQPVKVGDSWVAQQDVQNLEEIALTYTIEKISDASVLVSLTANNENIEGQYLIDRKTGFTQKGQLHIETTQDGKGLKMEINITSTEAP